MAEVRSLDNLHWVQPEDREHLTSSLTGTGHRTDFEVAFHRKDGSLVCVPANAHLLPAPLGESPRCEGMVADISQRKRVETERLRVALQKALAEVKALSGLLPICSKCKKVRDDQGYWNQIETYLASHRRQLHARHPSRLCKRVLS